MVKSSLISALCLVALVAVGSLAAQSSDTQQGQEQYLTGTVVSTSSTTLVVKTDAGDQMTFDVDSSSALPAQLAAGTRVDVGYKTDTGGKFHAMEVRGIGATGSGSAEPTKSDYDTGTAPSNPSTHKMDESSYKSHDKKLPQTASPIALIGLIGVGSLGAAAALKALSR